MASVTEKLQQLPEEMLRFTIQKATEATGPRLGTLAVPGRHTIDVPNLLGNTSRGVVQHLTQDNFQKKTQLKGVYVALEDCEYPATSYIRDLATLTQEFGVF
jgi:queuine tRNA-ribosyltransferase accessory subunit